MRGAALGSTLVLAATVSATPHPGTLPSSCWGRPMLDPGARPTRAAPSVFPTLPPKPVAPAVLGARLLSRFGDRRYVTRIVFGPPPPITRQHTGYFGKTNPPSNALWAYIGTTTGDSGEGPASMLRTWEIKLVEGGLRDDLCAAGGRPLVGWSVGGHHVDGLSDLGNAFNQRFPNPTPTAFRATLRRVAHRYGFTVVKATILHPLQLAPVVVVSTDRDRESFVRDVPAIVATLDRAGARSTAFEGMFFEASDAAGPFVRVERAQRGEVEGGQWVAPGLETPYPHL